VAFAVVAMIALAANGAYRPRFNLQFLEDLRAIVGATAIAAMSVTFARVVFSAGADVASQEVRAWLFAATYLAAGRAGYRIVQAAGRRQGTGSARTLIIGAGRVGHQVAARLVERPEFGLRPVAFFDADPLDLETALDLPVLGRGERGNQGELIEGIVGEYGIEEVIVTFSLATHDLELAIVRRCLELGVGVSLIPRLFEAVPDQTALERIGGIPLVSVHPSDPRGWQFELKYACDRVVAVVGVVLLSPVILLAGLGTLITLGRPIFFRQHRVGIDGHEFDMLKFRTMRSAESTVDPGLAEDLERGLAPGGVEGEDKRTRFGSFLRRTSIDEVPQLFNVVRGDMSLIGPRPERPEYVRHFVGDVHRYGDRLRVKSGITGWAQVHGLRGRTSIADRIEWDNYYIENWSFWLDLKVMARTVLAVFRARAE
jgi:exopolysaccharide biosynthesis polyprenyl glycosylphosphotransferase